MRFFFGVFLVVRVVLLGAPTDLADPMRKNKHACVRALQRAFICRAAPRTSICALFFFLLKTTMCSVWPRATFVFRDKN